MSRNATRAICLAAAVLGLAALAQPGSAGAVEAPSIEGESVSGITAAEATLEAEINVQGVEHGLFYQFQLLPDPGEAPTELACPPSPPPGYSACVGPQSPDVLPIGFVAGPGLHSVTQKVSGLVPGHTYFYRVLAAAALLTEDTVEWEGPALVGQSLSFETPTVTEPGQQGSQGQGSASPPPLPGNGRPAHPACHRHPGKRRKRCGRRHHQHSRNCGARKHHRC